MTPRVRGVFYVRPDPRHGSIAQSWRRKQYPSERTPHQVMTELQFGYAAKLSAKVNAYDLDFCKASAEGTQYIWRDIATMLSKGTFLTLRNLDGTIWQEAVKVSTDPQYILDLVTQTVGDLLWRDTPGWMGLTIGPAGFVLTSDGAKPAWAPPQGGGGGSGVQIVQPNVNNYAMSGAFNTLETCPIFVPAGMQINSVTLRVGTGNAGQHWRIGVYDDLNAAAHTLQYDSGDLGATVSNTWKKHALTTPVKATVDSIFWLAWVGGAQSMTWAGITTSRSVAFTFAALPATCPTLTGTTAMPAMWAELGVT